MYTVIAVDDEPWVGKDLTNNVPWEKTGFRLSACFTDPLEACEYVLKNNPDIVLLDITMPGMDAFAVHEYLTDNGYEGSFIIISAHRSFDYAQKAIGLSFSGYIVKPIHPEKVIDILNKTAEALDRKRLSNIKGMWNNTAVNIDTSGFSIADITDYIDRNLYDPDLSLDIISNRFFISKTYICFLFAKKLDTTFTAYLTEKRISLARNMLVSTTLPIKAISRKVGFNDELYFSKVFKKYNDMSPGIYRKLNTIV